MSRFYLSLGSNIQPQRNIPACLTLLRKKFDVKKVSSIYETDPVGPAGEVKFWNLAVEIAADLSRTQLLEKLREIEDKLGRARSAQDKFLPRTIDIDILPQADYQKMAFIIVPLAEIAPRAKDEESGRTFQELALKLSKENPAIKKSGPFESFFQPF